mmetsp:Transcript_16382/g.35425  ORF Transcript_16382/g.35425 Transcript_16382/m.35425 type:complete len:81 (+) Transcript_16382:769-1011(+)
MLQNRQATSFVYRCISRQEVSWQDSVHTQRSALRLAAAQTLVMVIAQGVGGCFSAYALSSSFTGREGCCVESSCPSKLAC